MDENGFVELEFFDKPFAEQAEYFLKKVYRNELAFYPPEPHVTMLSGVSQSPARYILAESAEHSAQVIHDPENQFDQRVLNGLSIPAGMEMIHFVFSIKRCSRVFTHQMVRHRLASISQSNSRDRVLPPVFVLPFDPHQADRSIWGNTIEHIHSTYKFYLLSIMNGMEPQDARYFLPDCIAQSMVFGIDFKSLQPMMAQRLCLNMQPEMSFTAWKMKQLVTEVLGPQFGSMLRPGCDRIKKCWPIQCNVYDCCGKWPTTKDSKTGKKPYSQTSTSHKWKEIREVFYAER